MDEHMIPFSSNKIFKVKQLERNYFRISMDHKFIGYIRREGGGWQMEENSQEDLTAENVQLIGDQIDKLRWQLTQWY
jgi:hypothetical protein